jgi:serine/threonine protein kinase
MEYAECGDVDSMIKKHKTSRKPIDEQDIWNIISCSLKGLRDLHQNNIIHRDIKPANLFVCRDKKVKLGDLNVSKMLKHNDELAKTQTGTP